MSLEKIKESKQESADYIVDEIKKVVDTYGKRDAGSDGEKAAVEYMAETLKEYADDVKVEPFEVHPAAFMGWIYISASLILLGFACYFFMPILTVACVVIALGLMAAEFIFYRQTIDKMFKAKTSHNATAIKKPSGEVKRRILFSGHADAAYEWTMNYHFGGAGFIGHFLIAMVGIVYTFVIAVISLIKNGVGMVNAAGAQLTLGYIGLAFIPFIVLMYWLWNERIIADGANDDLTGCFMSIALLKALKDNGVELENTEVGVVITGSEEAGLRGAKAWCEAHKGEFDDVETVILSFDTIHDGRFLGVNDKDLNNLVKADKRASDLFYNASVTVGAPIARIGVPLGATDSAAFNQAGFKCIGITAMNHVLEDYYHTRKDTYDNLDVKGLADCFEAAVQALYDFDSGK